MESETKLFGFTISSWPKWLIFLVGAAGIFSSFLVQGISQETLYTKFNFRQTIFFTFIQFFGYFLFSSGFIVKLIQKKENLHSSIQFYSLTSFSLCLSMGFSNLSVEKLSYPTAVLFKSSKMIPVMIGNMIFLKKKYSFLEILSILMIVTGLIGISYSDKVSKNQFNISGVILAILSLSADAHASTMQEKALIENGASQNEVISMMYLIGSIITFFVALVTGQLFQGINCCIQNPSMIFYLACFAFLGSIGVQFIYLIMKSFGSLVTVTVTSLRKAMTVCLSFILFPNKRFTILHFLSILSIFLGLFVNFAAKQRKKSSSSNFEDNQKNDKNEKKVLTSKKQTDFQDDSFDGIVKQTAVKGA